MKHSAMFQEENTTIALSSERQSLSSIGVKECSSDTRQRTSRVTFLLEKTRSNDEVSIVASSVPRITVPFLKTSIFSGSGYFDDISCDTISKESVVVGKQNAVNIYGVRIIPAIVAFANAFENQSYMETVSVQNVSKCCVKIRIHNARAWSFRLTPLERGHLLAPGLKITRRIHYTCTKSGIVHSSLPIYVNEKCFELPLEAYKGQAFVEIVPSSINFGRVDIGSKPVEKRLVIRNVSSCATKFSLDLGRNELDLQVTPLKGWIRPHSSVTIRLQLIALEVGELSSEIWITTDLSQSRVNVEVQACKRSLVALHPNSNSDFTLIEFPTTFYGCRRYQTVVVYNMAAASSAFVVLVDFGNQEHQPLREAKQGSHSQVKMFDVEPVEGRIRPFEGRIFTVWFEPVANMDKKLGWKNKEVEEAHDFLCAVRIKRIQVDDFGAEEIVKSKEDLHSSIKPPLPNMNKRISFPDIEGLMVEDTSHLDLTHFSGLDDISVLLCLYGEAELATLTVVPDCLHFTGSQIGLRENKVIHITNSSSRMLAFRYNKMPFFDVTPNFKKITPKTTCDVAVTYCARNLGAIQKELKFDVLAPNNSTDETDFQVVNYLSVSISGSVKSKAIVPQAKFNPGITPMITHEVGFLTDKVTFASKIKKPKCAMVAVNKSGRPWLRTDATIAFPNDMPLTLRARETDHTAKTIFKGLERYIAPVDESLTYTVDKLLQKKAHDNMFLEYIRGTAALSVTTERCCKFRQSNTEPDPPLVFEDKSAREPQDVLVPLTFIQLYRITVSPALISFGSVTTSKNCTQLLTIENNNNFKISAKIIPITSGVHVQTLENFIINERSETKIVLTFHRETLGRYSGTITCVINGYHSFDIAVVAEVVPKSLAVFPDRVEYRLPELPFAQSYVPLAITNPLNTPVSFSWSVPEGSPFKVEPTVGVTPKKGMVWCAAYFEPDSPNYKLHPLRMFVEGVICHKLKSGVTLPKPNVYFLEPTLNIGYIPLKLTTAKRCVVFNPDFCDIMFVILNKEPIKGVLVYPPSGTIKARSCFTLSLNISIATVGPLDFLVYMNIQNSVTIELKVTGVLVYPQVEITPKYINLVRIPCHSVTRTTLFAENKSKARTEVNFNMEEYPQFKVSLSKKHHDAGLTCKGFGLEPGSTQKFYLHFIPKDLASYDFYLPITINNVIGYRSSSTKENESHAKKIKSLYRSVSTFKSSGSRKSPVIRCQKSMMSHMVLIDVAVLKPVLVISDSELFFNSTSESKHFTTTNASEEPVNILFRAEEAQLPAFSFSTEKGHTVRERNSAGSLVMPGDVVDFTAVLTATVPGTYTADIIVMFAQQEHVSVYNCVRMSGVISPPCTLYSSVSDVYFEPVPLGVEISFMFHLTVNTYKQSKETLIDYEFSDSQTEFFSVEFPKGNTVVANCKLNLPVKLTFRSSIPVSVKKLMTFRGSVCGECTVDVFATADNCALTTHAFIKSHSPCHQTLKENEDSIDRTESELILATDRNILQPKQQLIKSASLEKISSSDSSSISISYMSLHTTPSTNSPIGKKVQTQNIKGSIRGSSTGLFNNVISDMELSLQLNSQEDKTMSGTEGLVLGEVVTKEGEESIFPKFPMEPAITEYAVHMNQTCYAVQQWVYEQVFNCSYYPILGSYMFSTFVHVKKDYGRSTPVAMKNVFDVLERICGRNVRRYFTPLDKLPEDNNAKVLFTYNVYKQLLDFMKAQGALLSHVEPQYLMGYDEYCLYSNMIPSTNKSIDSSIDESRCSRDVNKELPSPESFKSISIQCWLDLFLQMFRTLILGPTVGMKLDQEVTKRFTSTDCEIKKTLYSRSEEILMLWLTNHYNTQRSVVWPHKPPAARTITNFDIDLEDGLVLTAVTAAYCPFLTTIHFQALFLQPVTVSQAYHNTVCLTSAWDRIKMGFSVTPRDFVRPNTVKMLMLVAHLYRILPSYKAESTIKFKATLNSSETQIVTLENVEESAITYHIEVLPNSTCFTLDDCKDSYVLKRKQKGEIMVRYTARNTAKVDAILLLCGACMPPKFGRNYVFRLEGYPVKLPVSSIFNILSPLNTASTTRITIDTPHNLDQRTEDTVVYDIWVTDMEPQPGNLNALCWAKERKRKIPRRLFILSDKLVVEVGNRQKAGQLLLQICCFSQTVYYYWLLFMNPQIGDFIVKLQVSPGPPEPSTTLLAVVETKARCSCEFEKSFLCSRATSVNIPCRNLDQWAAVRTMFELTISPMEKEFWTTYIESNIGFRLLQWMLQEKKERLNEEIELIFKKSKIYKVNCKSPHIFCSPIIHIPNVRARTSVPVQLHFAQDTPNHTTVLTLTSSDGQEIRCYTLNVVCK